MTCCLLCISGPQAPCFVAFDMQPRMSFSCLWTGIWLQIFGEFLGHVAVLGVLGVLVVEVELLYGVRAASSEGFASS